MGLADIAASVGRSNVAPNQDDYADIITFIEAPWGLNLKLFPVQRVILKAHYGMALDDNAEGFPLDIPVPKDHPIYDPVLVDEDGFYKYRIVVTDFNRENHKCFTEAQYLKFLHEQGRSNIREVIPGKQRREMVLSIGRRSGKCVTGDTLVLTEEGVIPIKELGDPYGPEVQPMEIGVAGELPSSRVRSSYYYNGGVKPTYKIETHQGFSVEGTANHRVRVMGEDGQIQWRYLGEIHEGEHVVMQRGTNLWSSEYTDLRPFHSKKGTKKFSFPDYLTEDWGYLLGLLVGDGTWTSKITVQMTVGEPPYRDKVASVFDKLLGGHHYKPDKRRNSTGQVICHGQALREFLHNLGWSWECGKRDKMVPWAVMRSPKSVVCAFLRGLFDSDGCATKKTVSFSSASKRLAHEVQILLMNLGAVSRLRTKYNKKYDRNYYELVLTSQRARAVFAENIGFGLDRKQSVLMEGLKGVRDHEIVPHMRLWIRKLLESVPVSGSGQGWRRSNVRVAIGNTIKSGSTEEVTYNRLKHVLEVSLQEGADPSVLGYLQDLHDKDYFYDKIIKVSHGEERVYDLTVPDGHAFVANGMVNHNTLITSCIIAYESYKLLLKGNPQKFYGSSQSNVIQLISVATDKDQAGLLYREASGHFSKCDFFKPYMANATQSFATFQTPYDIEEYGSYKDNPKARYSINVTFRSCVAKGLRGGANIFVAMDEVAHFGEKGQASADDVYQAVEPSTRTFSPKDPKNTTRPIGENEGRIVLISSPLGKQGLFYKQFQLGFGRNKAADNLLCIQAPTWEVNPTVPAETFVASYLKDPNVFFTEFGAEFTDRTRGWIEQERDLIDCIDTNLKPKFRAPALSPHFMGIDVALVGDYTAIAIGHVDPISGKIVLDLTERIRAGEGDFLEYDRLEFDDVADWIADFTKRFYIVEGIFDQWLGIPMEQALQKRGLNNLVSVYHSRQVSSQMFQNFKNLMLDKRISLYDWPLPNDGIGHSAHIQEMLELQQEVVSKYIINVEAPNIDGKHDDFSDAIVRMVWAASKGNSKSNIVTGSKSGSRMGGDTSPLGRGRFGRIPGYANKSGIGSHPSRMAIKGRR